MNTAAKTRFAVKPLVSALALALSAANVYADPPPLAQPGSGLIVALTNGANMATNTTATTGFIINGGGVVGSQVWDGYASSEIRIYSPTPYVRGVIRWAGFAGSNETRNSAGFNIGALAKLTFTSGPGVTDAAILNIDASGFQSAIFGQLISSITGDPLLGAVTGAPPSLFVSNANGIIVGPGGHIVAPTGVGLLGANLNTADRINDFIANNNVVPANPATPGESYINIAGTLSKVENYGSIDGNAIASTPAQYILLAGSNVINDGILFAKDIRITAGLTPVAQKGTVNGVTNVTVNRIWITDQPAVGYVSGTNVCASAGCWEILAANAASGFTNTGTVASKFLGTGGVILASAAGGGITSGIQGSTDQLIGLFADSAIILNATGKTSLFNVNTGFTTGTTLPSLRINTFSLGYGGDVLIDALTPAAQPSSITTTGSVEIAGADIVINSAINFYSSGPNTSNLFIAATKSVTTTASGDVGAATTVDISSSGAGGINLAGDVASSILPGFGGSVNINNSNKGAATTITGEVFTNYSSLNPENINLTTNGPLSIASSFFGAWENVNITNNGSKAPTTISGFVVSRSGDINVTVMGPLDVAALVQADTQDVNIIQNGLTGGMTTTISGNVFAEEDIFIENNGGQSTNLNITGTLTVGTALGSSDIVVLSGGNLMMAGASAVGVNDDIFIAAGGSKVLLTGAQTAGSDWEFHAANATTKLLPAATIQANAVTLEALNFVGVNASGNTYEDTTQKPLAQIISNFVDATLYGSINAPVAFNTYWPTNAMWIKALDPSFPVVLNFSAIGGGFQAINLGITGDAFVSSGLTRTPFDTVGFTSSVLLPPPLVANGGSSLILQATGNMDIVGNGAPFLFAPNAFEFPGGAVFIAGGILTSQVPIYNAWTTNALQFQGIFKEAPTIIDNSYNATNTNSWVNYSTYPVTGPGNAYRIVQSVPGLFQFVLDPLIVHKNTYTAVLFGTPTNYCPGGFPPYCP